MAGCGFLSVCTRCSLLCSGSLPLEASSPPPPPIRFLLSKEPICRELHEQMTSPIGTRCAVWLKGHGLGCRSVVEHVLSMLEALGWVSSTKKQDKSKKKARCEGEVSLWDGWVPLTPFSSTLPSGTGDCETRAPGRFPSSTPRSALPKMSPSLSLFLPSSPSPFGLSHLHPAVRVTSGLLPTDNLPRLSFHRGTKPDQSDCKLRSGPYPARRKEGTDGRKKMVCGLEFLAQIQQSNEETPQDQTSIIYPI